MTAPDADGAGAGHPLPGIVRSGLLAVLLHPLSSSVTVACLATMAAPLLAGLGIARGVADAASVAVEAGADVHVSGLRYGRPAPLPMAAAESLRAIPGVVSVEPRIVGAVTLGTKARPAVVVGVLPERLPATADFLEGRPCRRGPELELVVGAELAERFGFRVGSAIPPFYRNRSGERVARVVGILRREAPPWFAHVALTTFDDAAEIFDERGTTTSFLVRTSPGYAEAVAGAVLRMTDLAGPGADPLGAAVVSRGQVLDLVARRNAEGGGALTALWALAFAVGVPLVLATTGVGLSERRREVGLLRALGWRTDEIVLRGLVESMTLALLGASLGLLAAWTWVRVLGGAGIAAAFLPDANLWPAFDVPFRLLPEATAAAFAGCLAIASVGSAGSAWRASSAEPAEAMR